MQQQGAERAIRHKWPPTQTLACSGRLGSMEDRKEEGDAKQLSTVPTVSKMLKDNTLVELLYQPGRKTTALAMYNAGRWTVQNHIDVRGKYRLVPFSPQNNLIKNEVVLLPSEPRIYGSEGQLLGEIQNFIRRYVDLSSTFE